MSVRYCSAPCAGVARYICQCGECQKAWQNSATRIHKVYFACHDHLVPLASEHVRRRNRVAQWRRFSQAAVVTSGGTTVQGDNFWTDEDPVQEEEAPIGPVEAVQTRPPLLAIYPPDREVGHGSWHEFKIWCHAVAARLWRKVAAWAQL